MLTFKCKALHRGSHYSEKLRKYFIVYSGHKGSYDRFGVPYKTKLRADS
jgi:hypothetical protein